MKSGPKIKTMEERFWPKVKKTKNCWWWLAWKVPHGYGVMSKDYTGKKIYAHRASWIIHFGSITDNLCVLHKCDNTSCVNPKHLFVGTQKDNIADMVNKGRKVIQRGEEKSYSKLKNDDVYEIRRLHALGIKSKKIAPQFNIRPGTVRGIVFRRSWRHI